MESAFGIDHGYDEIEKFEGLGTGLASMTRNVGSALSRKGAGLRRAAQPGTGARMATPGKINKPMQSIGAGMGKVGGSLRKLSTNMAANPIKTGAIATGVGGVGVGAAGAGLYSNRRR
jgi:hypothetical protein